MTNQILPNNPQDGQKTFKPNDYFTKGMWQKMFSTDRGKGHKFRRFMASVAAYPFHWFEPDLDDEQKAIDERGQRQEVANARAILHTLADELTEDDVIGVSRIAAILISEPIEPNFHARQQQESVRLMEAFGVPGQVIDRFRGAS